MSANTYIPIVEGDEYDLWYGEDLIRWCNELCDELQLTVDNKELKPMYVYKVMNDAFADIHLIATNWRQLVVSQSMTDNEKKSVISYLEQGRVFE